MLMSFTHSGPEVLSSVAVFFPTTGRSCAPSSEDVSVYLSLSSGKGVSIHQTMSNSLNIQGERNKKKLKNCQLLYFKIFFVIFPVHRVSYDSSAV